MAMGHPLSSSAILYKCRNLLAAAWKVIKGWLPAAGVKKIKFVAKATVGEFVRAEDRLTEWGGDFAYDPSKFDPGPGPAAPAEINGNVEDAKSAAEDTVSLASTICAPAPVDNNAGGLLRLGPSANDIVFDKNGYGDLVARSETQNRIGCFILTVVERQVTSITESIQRSHRINPTHMYTYVQRFRVREGLSCVIGPFGQ